MEWFRRAQAPSAVMDKFGRRVVSAPAGPLGILVTASSHGTPQIGSVEPGSVLRDAVECGDLLLCVGAHDVSRLPYDRAASLLNSLAAGPRRLVLLPIGAATPSAPALFERADRTALKTDESAAPSPVREDDVGSRAHPMADAPRDSTAAAAALALWAVSEGELMRDAAARREAEEACKGAVCSISGELMRDPVITLDDGHSYERSAIEAWFARESEAAAAAASTAGATTGAQATPGAGAGSSPPGASTASAPRATTGRSTPARSPLTNMPLPRFAHAFSLSRRVGLCSHPLPSAPPSPPNPTARFAVQRRARLKSRPANRFVTMARTS